MYGPKHVASHTIKHDVFDGKYFIILVLNFNTSGCLQSNNKIQFCEIGAQITMR